MPNEAEITKPDATTLAVIHLEAAGWEIQDADRDRIWLKHKEAEGELEISLADLDV